MKDLETKCNEFSVLVDKFKAAVEKHSGKRHEIFDILDKWKADSMELCKPRK